MSTFNVRVTYKGEGDLNFHIPIVGEIKIWPGRDIFLEGATVEIIEALCVFCFFFVVFFFGGV